MFHWVAPGAIAGAPWRFQGDAVKTLHILLGAAALGTSLFASAAANAEVLYDNLNAAPIGQATAFLGAEGPLYDSFSTGNSKFLFTTLSLMIRLFTPSDGGFFDYGIFTDDMTSPGIGLYISPLYADSTLSTTFSAQTFDPDILLNPNTRYWVGLATSGSVLQGYSSDISGPGVANEYWSDAIQGVHPNSVRGPFHMAVIGTAVPEPSTWALMLAGFGGLGWRGLHLARKAQRAAVTA